MRARFIAATALILTITAGCIHSPVQSGGVEIHDVQGCGHTSPLKGQKVRNVQGIVTKKYSNGFVMQAKLPDELDCSSEAIFIHTSNYADVILGDLVAVDGTVAEYSLGGEEENNLSQTEITKPDIQVISGSNSYPEPVLLGKGGRAFPEKIVEDDGMKLFDPLTDGLDFYESLEWMLVELPQMRVVGPRNNYNEIVVVEDGPDGKNATEGHAAPYERASIVTEADWQPERIMIELPSMWKATVNMGDTLEEGMKGVMTYSYGNYKLEPSSKISIARSEFDPNRSTCIYSSKMRVANYNLNNFSQFSSFSKIQAVARQITTELCSPDVLVLEEIQDDSGEVDDGITSANENLNSLVEQIRTAGGPDYIYYDFAPENNSDGGIPGGNIRTVFLLRKDSILSLSSSAGERYRNGTISFTDEARIVLSPNPMQIGFDDPIFEHSRKPSVGLFTYGEQQVVIIGLHLVSKGMNSPLYGRIQPIEEPELSVRIAQARYVNKWAEQVIARSPNTIIIIAGDMNDSFDSRVLDVLKGNSFLDSAQSISPESRYSILLDGGAALFDHILVSKNAAILDADIFHINAWLDAAGQISDHDPVSVSIDASK